VGNWQFTGTKLLKASVWGFSLSQANQAIEGYMKRKRPNLYREFHLFTTLFSVIINQSFFLLGGEPGSPGLSLLLKADGRIVNLGGKASVNIKPGVS